LKWISAAEFVAGKTRMGIVTRLSRKWPFQIARAAMVLLVRPEVRALSAK
jgi:hypothetical protein